MPPIKFQLNLTYCLGGEVIWRFSRWHTWRFSKWPPLRPSWILEWNDCSNSESMLLWCLPSSFSSIWLNVWDVVWRISRQQPSWISEQYNFSNCESLCRSDASHQVLAQSDLQFGRRCGLKNFKMATMATSLDIRTEWFLQFWTSMSLRCLPSSFGSIWLMVCEEMSFEEFQHGCPGNHLGYWNRTILAILNLCVTVMPPIKFQLNLTYGLGGDVVWIILRWPPWRPSWISEQNNFCNSESPCCQNASHQVSAQSNMVLEEISKQEAHGPLCSPELRWALPTGSPVFL